MRSSRVLEHGQREGARLPGIHVTHERADREDKPGVREQGGFPELQTVDEPIVDRRVSPHIANRFVSTALHRGYIETQAQASPIVMIDLPKTLENRLQHVTGYAAAGVRHGETKLVCCAFAAKMDRAVSRGVYLIEFTTRLVSACSIRSWSYSADNGRSPISVTTETPFADADAASVSDTSAMSAVASLDLVTTASLPASMLATSIRSR
jgi:hypothetical protein